MQLKSANISFAYNYICVEQPTDFKWKIWEVYVNVATLNHLLKILGQSIGVIQFETGEKPVLHLLPSDSLSKFKSETRHFHIKDISITWTNVKNNFPFLSTMILGIFLWTNSNHHITNINSVLWPRIQQHSGHYNFKKGKKRKRKKEWLIRQHYHHRGKNQSQTNN